MSKDNNDSTPFNAEHIRRYLAGEMTGREMHALEKAALEDPFLADAIEGFRNLEPHQIPEDLAALRKAMFERRPANLVPLVAQKNSWYKYAAAAILVILAGTGAWFILNMGRSNNDLAIKSRKAEQPKEAVPDTVSKSDPTNPTPLRPETITDSKGTASAKQKPPQQLLSEPKDDSAKQNRVPAHAEKAADEAVSNAAPPVPESVIVKSEEKAKETELDKAKSETPSLSKKSASGNAAPAAIEGYYGSHLFRGKVVDKEGRPLPFVNVTVNKGASTLYTNAAGEFKLFSSDTSVELHLKSVGFFDQRTKLHVNDPDKRIMLDHDTNYGKPSKRRTALNNTFADSLKNVASEAEPADGWNNYDIYLVNNTRLPLAEQQTAFAGMVELSFTVNKNGTLTNFKIDRSLDPASDKEAIRLVKEGPKWELTSGEQPSRVSLTIFF